MPADAAMKTQVIHAAMSAYENCAKTAEAYGHEKLAALLRKLAGKIVATDLSEEGRFDLQMSWAQPDDGDQR